MTTVLSSTKRLKAISYILALFIAKDKVEILHKKSNAKSYDKTVIDFNFGRHKDLSSLKSDIHLGLQLGEYHFFGQPH